MGWWFCKQQKSILRKNYPELVKTNSGEQNVNDERNTKFVWKNAFPQLYMHIILSYTNIILFVDGRAW